MQGFTQLPEAGSLKFPNQPYNFVERVSAIMSRDVCIFGSIAITVDKQRSGFCRLALTVLLPCARCALRDSWVIGHP